MKLTNEERNKIENELEMLENPDVENLSPAMGALMAPFLNRKSKKKKRIIELRTTLRMDELGLNEMKDWEKYHQIKEEEEERVNKILK